VRSACRYLVSPARVTVGHTETSGAAPLRASCAEKQHSRITVTFDVRRVSAASWSESSHELMPRKSSSVVAEKSLGQMLWTWRGRSSPSSYASLPVLQPWPT
jgi:hypothetical protein